MLNLKDSNFLWFSDLFTKLLLFHGVHTAPQSVGTSSAAVHASTTNNPFSSPSPAVRGSDVSSASGAFATSPSRGTAFERALSAAASPGKKKPVITPSTTSNSNLNVDNVANFPGLSVKSLPLDATKHSKLEERLGMGGDAKANIFTPTHSAPTTKKIPPGAVHSPAATGATSSGAYKGRSGPPSRSNPGAASNLAMNAHTLDAYEAPAQHFAGSERFFFQFIVSMNNFRLNQGLVTCVLAQIDDLMRGERFEASFTAMDLDTGTPTKSKKLPIFLPSDQKSSKLDTKEDVFISPEDFALKVTKLKILGRFLGLLHFYHQWMPGAESGGPLSKLALDMAARRGALQMSLPILRVVQDAQREGKLSLALPWVAEFLKMLSWLPACSLRPRGQSTSASDRLAIPYFEVLERLRSIQHVEILRANGAALSCNRYPQFTETCYRQRP